MSYEKCQVSSLDVEKKEAIEIILQMSIYYWSMPTFIWKKTDLYFIH